jgi:hypothetical protein
MGKADQDKFPYAGFHRNLKQVFDELNICNWQEPFRAGRE